MGVLVQQYQEGHRPAILALCKLRGWGRKLYYQKCLVGEGSPLLDSKRVFGIGRLFPLHQPLCVCVCLFPPMQVNGAILVLGRSCVCERENRKYRACTTKWGCFENVVTDHTPTADHAHNPFQQSQAESSWEYPLIRPLFISFGKRKLVSSCTCP